MLRGVEGGVVGEQAAAAARQVFEGGVAGVEEERKDEEI
jgi:hypothetical protein